MNVGRMLSASIAIGASFVVAPAVAEGPPLRSASQVQQAENGGYNTTGMASFYGADFHNRKTANGEIFNMFAISAAHKTMPLPSYVRVTNLANGRSIVVRVNDRGPYYGGRIMDLSEHAAELLDYKKFGVAKIRMEYLGPAPAAGGDLKMLASTLRGSGGAAPPSAVATLLSPIAKPVGAVVAVAGNVFKATVAPVIEGGVTVVRRSADQVMTAPAMLVIGPKPQRPAEIEQASIRGSSSADHAFFYVPAEAVPAPERRLSPFGELVPLGAFIFDSRR